MLYNFCDCVMSIVLKPLHYNNLELVRKWRNENRNFFIHNEIISSEGHKRWYNQYKTDPTDTIFIIYNNKQPIGTISLSFSDHGVEIGRVILGEKEFSRKGIMGVALELLISKINNKRIFLKVLKTNTIAINFYKKHNFVITSEKNNRYLMERKT